MPLFAAKRQSGVLSWRLLSPMLGVRLATLAPVGRALGVIGSETLIIGFGSVLAPLWLLIGLQSRPPGCSKAGLRAALEAWLGVLQR